MAADASTIEKLAIYDDRIIQNPPRYGIVRGANSVNSMPFQANTASTSQHQYTIQVPNQGVFLDRNIEWTSSVALTFSTTCTFANPYTATASAPLLIWGDMCSLASFPLHRLVNVLNANINNQQVTFNGDILDEVLRLTDNNQNRSRRTCPSRLDTIGNYADIVGGPQDVMGPFNSSATEEHLNNGAWGDVIFTDAQGSVPATPTTVIGAGISSYTIVNNVPMVPAGTIFGAGQVVPFTFYIKFKSTEKLVLSPFIFAEHASRSTGMFGLNNIQLTMSIASPNLTGHTGRVLRGRYASGTLCSPTPIANNTVFRPVVTSVGFLETGTMRAFTDSFMNCQFLDPNWSEPLPPRSIVPYMDYTRYITEKKGSTLTARTAGKISETTVETPAITFPYIPDLLVISVRPSSYAVNNGSYTMPIKSIRLQWANRSGLLSQHTQAQLYDMTTENGISQTYTSWTGSSKCFPSYTPPATAGVPTGFYTNDLQTVGGFLVLRPGIDFPLDPSQAPGMVGNFLFQAQVTCQYTGATDYVGDLRVCTMAVNSGFFATVFGTSMIVRGVVMPEDAVRTNLPKAGTSELDRVVGGFWGKIGNALTKYMPYARQAAEYIKPHLSEKHREYLGKAEGVATALGYGNMPSTSGGAAGFAGGGKRRMLDRVGYE